MPVQCETATKLASWLASISRVKGLPSSDEGTAGFIEDVWHASLQQGSEEFVGEGKQMSIGSACFSFSMTSEVYAEHIGHNLSLFTVRLLSRFRLTRLETYLPRSQPAASLGAVESLVEQRVLADPKADPRMGEFRLLSLRAHRSERHFLTVVFHFLLVRISIGLEAFEDLKGDLIVGFAKVKALKL